ncbi:MAG: hypothetical protein LBF49_02965 [Puniceicoccales bacterium]|nr:hypothetical protein [Puniceicoccales bacterium]
MKRVSKGEKRIDCSDAGQFTAVADRRKNVGTGYVSDRSECARLRTHKEKGLTLERKRDKKSRPWLYGR